MAKNNLYYIIGAGFAGKAIASDIYDEEMGVVLAFLDDDPTKIGTTIFNCPVFGSIKKALPQLNKQAIALIAIPSLSNQNLARIFTLIKDAGFTDVRILPRLSQLLSPQGSFFMTREVDAADFLERDPIVLDLAKTLQYIKGKRVLITGAGGSIGSELARQLLKGDTERLYLLGHGENSIYNIERELNKLKDAGIGRKTLIIPIIGEIQDKEYLRFLLQRLQAQIVFHCAAHKHVPLMEKNPVEAVKNNVFGVENIIEAAKQAKIERFVLISTDKAVEPNNTYGVSKALGEQLVLNAYREGYPFFVVRFGNVLGSRGSIIPLFKEQVEQGGPLTVTHCKMRRYFMTIPEAVSLILLTGNIHNHEAIFLLDMGESLSILELAKKVAFVHGYDVDKGEIEIQFIGLREGETLEEKLYADYEECKPTEHPRLLSIKSGQTFSQPEITDLLNKLRAICYYNQQSSSAFRNKKLLHLYLYEKFPSLVFDHDEDQF